MLAIIRTFWNSQYPDNLKDLPRISTSHTTPSTSTMTST